MDLEDKARWVRQQVLEMVTRAGKGHIGGSFSCVEILVSLYYDGILHYNPQKPDWEDRDIFILSKGHACCALYPILADVGYFPLSELDAYCQEGSIFEAHANGAIPGIELTTGSLGQGLGIGAGWALAAKLDDRRNRIYVLLGDGECYEGSVWEAANFAAHHKLNNLIAIVDRNQQCVLDFTENCNKLEPFIDKWVAFGWNVVQIDGHNFNAIKNALYWIVCIDRPLVVIANTTKGKGVSFMERNLEYHHKIPTKQEYELGQKELSNGY